MASVILSVSGSDRPGLTEALAAAVLSAEGNWLESHLSRLGGLYVGSVLVALAAERIAAEVLRHVAPLRDVPDDSQGRPAVAGAVVIGGGVGDGLVDEAHGRTRGRSTDSRPAAVSSSGMSTGGLTS